MAGLHAQPEVTYEELVTTLNAFFSTKPFIIVKKTSSINLTEIEVPPPPVSPAAVPPVPPAAPMQAPTPAPFPTGPPQGLTPKRRSKCGNCQFTLANALVLLK
jgi:hypothetical protein